MTFVILLYKYSIYVKTAYITFLVWIILLIFGHWIPSSFECWILSLLGTLNLGPYLKDLWGLLELYLSEFIIQNSVQFRLNPCFLPSFLRQPENASLWSHVHEVGIIFGLVNVVKRNMSQLSSFMEEFNFP